MPGWDTSQPSPGRRQGQKERGEVTSEQSKTEWSWWGQVVQAPAERAFAEASQAGAGCSPAMISGIHSGQDAVGTRHAAARPHLQHAQGKAGQQATLPGPPAEPEPGQVPGRRYSRLRRRASVLNRQAGQLGEQSEGSPQPVQGEGLLLRTTHPPAKVPQVSSSLAAPPPGTSQVLRNVQREPQHKGKVGRTAPGGGQAGKADRAARRRVTGSGRAAAVTPPAAAGGSGGSGPGRRGARPARGSCQVARSGHSHPCV